MEKRVCIFLLILIKMKTLSEKSNKLKEKL